MQMLTAGRQSLSTVLPVNVKANMYIFYLITHKHKNSKYNITQVLAFQKPWEAT